MPEGKKQDSVTVLTKEDFFRPGMNFHIQMSREFPGYINQLHMHDYIELAYLISGNVTHEIQGKTYPAKQGDLFIINKGTPHAFYCEEESYGSFETYDLMFTPEFFDESIRGCTALEELQNSFVFYSLFRGMDSYTPYLSATGNTYTMFGELLNKIYLEYQSKRIGYLELIRGYLIELIVMIFRENEEAFPLHRRSGSKPAVGFVVDYIHRNFSRPISVQELAEKVYLNQDYLGRVFRNETGTTISAMIQKVRVQHACHLLSTTESTISSIAEECGFEDIQFFYRVFKKYMGVLPGDYRKQTWTVR